MIDYLNYIANNGLIQLKTKYSKLYCYQSLKMTEHTVLLTNNFMYTLNPLVPQKVTKKKANNTYKWVYSVKCVHVINILNIQSV